MKARELMLRVDQYQLKYNRDHVNVRESSFVSNKVYCGLRAFLNVIKQSFTDKYVTIVTQYNSGLLYFFIVLELFQSLNVNV